MVEKFQRELSETQAALYEEGQNRLRLQMEMDARESEIEQLKQKVMLHNSDTASINSGPDMDGQPDHMLGTLLFFSRNIYFFFYFNAYPYDLTFYIACPYNHTLGLKQFISLYGECI